MKPQHVKQQSLALFMQEKARVGCLVCALSKEVRTQLGRGAGKRGFSRQDQVEWLRAACGANTVTLDILNTHINSRHDREEDFNGA
jgi:hypothetical protein